MSLDVKMIKSDWEKDKPKYDALGAFVFDFIKKNINQEEILPDVSYRVKELISIIKKIKSKQIDKDYSYESLKDKLGLRIICDFQEDMDKVEKFIRNFFEVVDAEYKQEELNFDKLDYISNHYDLKIKASLEEFNEIKSYKNLIFEVQVRTLNQHAWSNTSHKLSYKQDNEISPKIKRKIYRLLSLYEIADDEFSLVNKLLTKTPENLVFSMINMLEGKIFKYANLDYNRDLSIYNLEIILKFFNIKEKDEIFNDIESYINSNEDKITGIFNENKSRFHEIPLLTQPEVFVIWFSLDHFAFSITDNWMKEFDEYELEQLANIWGTSID